MKRKKGKTTIFQRICFPLLGIAVLQLILLYFVFWVNGVFNSFDENAKDILTESTRNKYQILQTEMVSEWSALGTLEDTADIAVEAALDRNGKTWDDIHTDAQLNADIMDNMSEILVDKLRKSKATGIFLVLDGQGVAQDEDSYAGIYLRNRDPGTETKDNSDLGVFRGLPPVSRKLGIPLESFWDPVFRFEGGRDNSDNAFFFNPLDKAKETGITDTKNCCYWSHAFKPGGASDIEVITYSVPLINDDGQVYGVVGIELSTKYLLSQIYRGEKDGISQRQYYLGITQDEGKTYEQVAFSGARYDMSKFEALTKGNGTSEWMITAEGKNAPGKTLYGAVFPLKLYNNNAPFSEQQWVLIGFSQQNILFKAGNNFKNLMFAGGAIILFLSILMSVVSAYGVINPIRVLARKLQNNKEYEELELPQTKVKELDELSTAIMDMNHGIIESAKRTSKLIELSGLPVGVYEMRNNSETCYCSDGLFDILDCKQLKPDNNLMSAEKLIELLDKVMKKPVTGDVFCIDHQKETKYIRVVIQSDESGVIGTVLDVTKEMNERKKIEHERDFDTLTGIWNRRAFEHKVAELFDQEEKALGTAVMLMFDLDNLKSINDAYGHDCGDIYIRTFAKGIEELGSQHCIVARRSGDEFYALIYGYQNEEEVKEQIDICWQRANSLSMVLPDDTECRIRVSAGYSWYPKNTKDYGKLIHYADFAMYVSKQTLKGSIQEFDEQEYNRESFLFNGNEALNRLIDHNLVKFMFQPIVSARTGDLYGYEILMRSGVEELKTPDVILRMAKSQGKLRFIERLTWFEGLYCIQKGLDEGYLSPDAKIFINSIANQAISHDDQIQLSRQYKDIMPRIVLEVTEGENNNLEYTKRKLEFVQEIGGQVAIDDYGTGYNSELALVMIPAQIVKIDMTFVRNVNADKDKQIIIKNLINFARNRNISVLAEGVETVEEMTTLIGFGVDYLQGYYISKPQYIPKENPKVKEEIKELANKCW